ncbi:glycosyltransferase [Photobacterium leiognathi]|uniref:glycosyltransferase n=1 Tax=Photobacterium leiognathi TaxID=553611 RepID=UPI0027343A3E|nr:glycosyltransferase [Photobacterium leiognathi]
MILLQTKEKAFFDDDIISNDGRLIYLEYTKYNVLKYLWDIFWVIRRNKYDVVHAHVYHFSGIVLLIAFLAGVKVRISHCHNDKSSNNKSASKLKKCYNKICVFLLEKLSTKKIAVSKLAAHSLYQKYNNLEIIPCGLYFEDDMIY